MSSSIPMHDQMSEKFIKPDQLKTPRVKFTFKKTPISKSVNGNLTSSLSSNEDYNGNLNTTKNEKLSNGHVQVNQYSRSSDVLEKHNNRNTLNNDSKKRKGNDKKNVNTMIRKKTLTASELKEKYGERIDNSPNLVPSKKLKKQKSEEEDDAVILKAKEKKLDTFEKNAQKTINKLGIVEENQSLYAMKKTILSISDLIEKIEEKGDVGSIKEGFNEYQSNLKELKEIGKEEKNIVLIDILQANDMGINPVEYMKNSSKRYVGLCEDMIEKKGKKEIFKKFSDQLKASAQSMYPEDFKAYYENKGNLYK